MPRRPTSVLLSLALAAGGVAALSSSASAAPADGPLVYGLTATDGLVSFRASTGLPLSPVAITGLGGDDLVGIDTRPADGSLVGIGKGSGTPDSIFTIDPATAVATRVADLVFTPTDVLPDTALTGDRFAVDVNPVPDRIRVISNTGQNLRINPVTGAVVVDGDINGAGSPVVASAAYTNAVAGATTTTLFDIDVDANQLLVQNPPNNGTLANPVPLLATAPTTGTAAGFDIDPVTGAGYAVLDVAGTRSLYVTANPGTGPLTATGVALPGVADLAVATPRLGFGAAAATVAETAGSVSLTVNRVGDLGDTATVAFATADGTATAGSDYVATSGTLTFLPGQASATVLVQILPDLAVEAGETFGVTLSAPTASVLTATGTATVTITDQAATGLTLSATPQLRAPALATLSGVLTGPGGARLGGRSVALTYLFADGSAPVRTATTVTTAADGSFSAQVKPSRNLTWRAVYTGSATEAPASSPGRFTLVQLSSARATGVTTIQRGTVGSFRGYIEPASAQPKVKLQYLRGSQWVDLTGPVAVDAGGRFTLARTYANPGTFSLRILGLESSSNAGSASRVFGLRVL